MVKSWSVAGGLLALVLLGKPVSFGLLAEAGAASAILVWALISTLRGLERGTHLDRAIAGAVLVLTSGTLMFLYATYGRDGTALPWDRVNVVSLDTGGTYTGKRLLIDPQIYWLLGSAFSLGGVIGGLLARVGDSWNQGAILRTAVGVATWSIAFVIGTSVAAFLAYFLAHVGSSVLHPERLGSSLGCLVAGSVGGFVAGGLGRRALRPASPMP